MAASKSPEETTPLLGDGGASSDVADAAGDAENGRNDAEANGAAAQEGNPELRKKLPILFPAVAIGLLLVSVDQVITVATYAKIGSELKALNNTSWIATSYFITLTSFQPLYGKLSDIFGRRECLLFAYTVFGLGSLGCGLAQDIVQLCIARAVTGIGGGGMNAVVSILLTDIVPLRDRGLWQGYLNMVFAVGTSSGAPLGGLLADSVGWRWSFLVQAPLCVVAFVAVYSVLDAHPKSEDWFARVKQIDFLGAFTLIIGVVGLLVGLDFGSNLGWSHLGTIIPLSLTPVIFALFIFVEIKVATVPFAPGRVIFGPGMLSCYLINFFSMCGYIGIVFFAPMFFQAVQGLSATQSGALLVPGMIASVTASLGSGWVMRKTGKYRTLTIWSIVLCVLSMVPQAVSFELKNTAAEVVALVVSVFGASAAISTTLIGLLANAAKEDAAVAVACSYLFRSLGASFGIGTGSAVLQQVLRSQLAARLTDADQAREIERRVRESLDVIKTLPPHIAEQVRTSYRWAVLGASAPMLVYFAVALIVSFWVRDRPLKK